MNNIKECDLCGESQEDCQCDEDEVVANYRPKFGSKTFHWKEFTEDEEINHELPGKWEACSDCDGEGRHLRTSMRDLVFTRDDYDEDPDFIHEMVNGAYDQTCGTCHGQRVELVLNEDTCDPEILKRYHKALDEESAMRAMHESERRMGC